LVGIVELFEKSVPLGDFFLDGLLKGLILLEEGFESENFLGIGRGVLIFFFEFLGELKGGCFEPAEQLFFLDVLEGVEDFVASGFEGVLFVGVFLSEFSELCLEASEGLGKKVDGFLLGEEFELKFLRAFFGFLERGEVF
jgi:hypothetical protein